MTLSLARSLNRCDDEAAVGPFKAEGKDIDECDEPLDTAIGTGISDGIGEGISERAASRCGYGPVAMHLAERFAAALRLQHETRKGRVADRAIFGRWEDHILNR